MTLDLGPFIFFHILSHNQISEEEDDVLISLPTRCYIYISVLWITLLSGWIRDTWLGARQPKYELRSTFGPHWLTPNARAKAMMLIGKRRWHVCTCTLNNHKMFWRKRNHFEQNKKRYFSSYSLVSPFSRGFWKSKVEKYLRSVGKRRWHQDISWKNESFLLQLARPLCQGCPERQQSWAIFAFCWQAEVIL